MAAVTNARGVKLVLKFGNGASPEVFSAKCSINAARGLSFTAGMREILVPDCSDPDAVAWLGREKESLSMTFNGAGMLNTPDVEDFYDWWKSEAPMNVQAHVDVASASGGGHFDGAFFMTDFEITGDRGSRMEFTASFASDGEVEWVPAS